MDKFGYFCAFMIVLVVGILVNAAVLCQLWGWFVMSLSENVPALVMAHAIGLVFTVRVALDIKSPDTDKYDGMTIAQIIAASIGEAIIQPLLILLFGYLIACFMP